MPEITNDDLFEATSLVYRQWAECYDALKLVKAEEDDGSDDWAEFHKARLENAIASEAKWRGLKERMMAQLPRAI